MLLMQSFFLMFVAAVATSQTPALCPSSCYCDEDSGYVSCVGDGLWQLPSDLPNSTVRLELRNYLASTLTAEDVEDMPNLVELKLQQSRIETVENGTFYQNQLIQRLDLSQNSLSSLSSAVFYGLKRLRFLDVSSNFIQNIEEAFVDLVSLEQLNLRDNRIPQLTTHTFVGLHKVQYMNLDANNISFVEVGTFQYLTNLAHLIISNNPLSTLSRLDFFGSRLQFIDISHVGLDRIPQSLTKFVRDLRLAKNNLTRISAGDFDSYPYLGLLVLDDNCVSEIENDALGRQEYLMRLWLNGNCLSKVPPNLPPSLLALYMEENKLSELYSYSFKGLVHLEQLFLQRNSIRVLEQCVFCDLVTLKSLDLQANQIENLTAGVFANLSQLETLDLSQNNLKIIDSRCFDGLGRLKTLQISRVPTFVNLDEAMFDPLQNLQNLEVYDSALLVHKIINSTRMLHGLRKVQELNIMHNRIVRLRSDFPSFLPNLKMIKMSGNLWHCNKDIIWLATWIKMSNVQFYSSYSIRCATPESLQYKPLMMLTESDFAETTTVNDVFNIPTINTVNSSVLSTHEALPTRGGMSTTPLIQNILTAVVIDTTTSSGVEGFVGTIDRTETSSISKETEIPDQKFISADPYRYSIIRENFTPPSEETSKFSSSYTSYSRLVTEPSTPKEFAAVSKYDINTYINQSTGSQSLDNSTSPTDASSASTTGRARSSAEPGDPRMTEAPQRTVLSSRLRGWTSGDTATGPPHWDHATTTVIVSAIVAVGGLLVIVGGIVTLFTLIRCRHRYQPVKHKNMRRSSSISYYPQKDEVSIVTLTEGTVGLRTNSHHGLGNKLYYIMENGNGTSTDVTRDALPDPQLQELLPQSSAETSNVY